MFDLIFGGKTQQLFSKTITIAAIVILIYLFLYFFSKFKPVQSLFYGIVFLLLVASGVMSFGNLNIYYSTKGGVIGEITSIFKKNQVEVTENEKEIKFDFSNIVLEKNSQGKYSASMTSNTILNLDSDEEYFIYVNDEPCTTVKCEKRDIYATYSYVFMDRENGEYRVLADDVMTFYFALYSNYSYLYIEVENGEETAGLWNSYFNKNNFKAVITKVSNDFYSVAEYKTIRLFSVDYKTIKTIKLKLHSDYVLPQLKYDGITYKYWKNSKNEIVSKIYDLTEDLDLYGLNYIPVETINYEISLDNSWYTNTISEIQSKTYNIDFKIKNEIIMDYIQGENFEKIEIEFQSTILNQTFSSEYAQVYDWSSFVGQTITLTIKADGSVYCYTKLNSNLKWNDSYRCLQIENGIIFSDGYTLNDDEIVINGEFNLNNLIYDYQSVYPNDNITSDIFTGVFSIDSVNSIKIYE